MTNIIEILKAGDSASRVDIVIVAEGYTAAERDKFIADAQTFVKNFLGQENAKLNAPFSNYSGFFNATALFFESAESGMDRPNDGVSVNTYFNASQQNSDGRLLYGDISKVQFEVSKAMAGNAQELVIVLVNTPIYGGAGGSVAWASAGNQFASELALHEIGHSYANLQDEYVDSATAPFFPLTASSFLKSAHVTDSLNRIPWNDWLGFNDGDLGVVGKFEGGYYRAAGIWRATQDSKMLTLGKAFSAPQKEAFALKFYSDIGDYLTVTSEFPGLYQAVTPNQKLFSYTWKFDGKTIATNTGNLFDAYANGAYAIGSKLSLTTIDNTGLIRKNIATTQQVETIQVSNAVFNVSDISYSLLSTDSGKIISFSADDNLIKLSDINQLKKIYIDGGLGKDTLQFDINLTMSSGIQIKQLESGSFLISSQGESQWAVRQVEKLVFKDFTINTSIAENAAGISKKALNDLSELYVAYFNRIPEADGLDYWITQFKNGMSINQIGDAFFIAARDYPELTGYSSSMTDAEFIHVIYKNALGRAGGADEAGLQYWLKEFVNGTMTKGTMVHAILVGAHERNGDPSRDLEANLLDNKIIVANKFAVEWGLNYLTPELSITNGMKMAALVTPTDTMVAISLIGVEEGQIQFM